ncbi:MAG: DNA topoisomerase III [Betaproteobacteria bacterium]|nr:DNA topoisomerase III [Betaproteobacteria bacterium]
MTKTLIIAEKPSVATDISKALGGFTKQNGYYESDQYVLSWAVGHLLEIYAADDPKRGKWTFTHLPVIPKEFALQPIAKNEERLRTLNKLIKRKDVKALINACDAGREGELIFRLIVQNAKAKQTVQRLWLQSMTPAAIRDGFAHLRSDNEMAPLADAARSRAEADWLVGINGTRAMTAFNSKTGGFYLTTVGRVQTPTLAIVVDREKLIKQFVPRDYWEVRANFAVKAGEYEGRWFDPKFKKSGEDPDRRENRLWSKQAAEAIVAACAGKAGKVSEESKPSSQLSPLLYDLTSIQREANGRFGFSAKTTLSIVQELYEKHKAVTYPRTDSRHLPEDYLKTVKSTLSALEDSDVYGRFGAKVAKQGWVKPDKRIFDNTKVSDHFAIIPTQQLPKALNEVQGKIYDMIVRRFLAVFYPAAEFLVTTRITEVEKHQFKTDGKVLVSPGWMEVYGKDALGEDSTLVEVKMGEKAQTRDIEASGLQTKPPPRYSEATLLSAMEGAGKLIEDDELREAMSQKGLGTPATRAAIIEGLISDRYLLREGRELIPTAKAFQLMTLLHGLDINELTQPELTGEWEYKLAQMERGKLKRESFIKEIARMATQIVKRAKEYDNDTIPGDYATLKAKCPNCKATVKENYRRFACEKCEFSITKTPAGRQFEIAEVEELLTQRQLGPIQGFRSKIGRPFAAILRIVHDDELDNYKLEFDFGQSNDNEAGEAVDFTGQQALGSCPKCSGAVYEHGMNYVCENTPAKQCDFRTGKIILQQEIGREQVEKLLRDGRTDLLPRFISKKGRPFKAYLVKGAGGKITFEFEARKPTKGRSKAADLDVKAPPITKATKEAAISKPRRKAA